MSAFIYLHEVVAFPGVSEGETVMLNEGVAIAVGLLIVAGLFIEHVREAKRQARAT